MRELSKCAICGGEVEETVVEYLERYHPDAGTVIFGNVPAKRCKECGERFYKSDTAIIMDKVLQEKIKAKKTIELPFYPIKEYNYITTCTLSH